MIKVTGIILSAAIAAAAAISVYAQDNDVVLTVTGNALQTDYNDSDSGTAVLCFYENDMLVYSAMAKIENNVYSFDIDEKYYDYDMRIGYIGGEVYDAVISEGSSPSESAVPTATSAPVQTETPSATASPAPTKTPYPDIYPRSLDAINAPMVVKSNDATLVDGEEYYDLTVLYQGAESVISVRGSAQIKSAPDSQQYLVGMNAGALQEGDVIHLTAYASGPIKSIEFIYRPDATDYINSDYDGGDDFRELYSDSGKVAGSWSAMSYNSVTATGDGYIFGVPVKATRGYMILANKDGEIKEINMAEGTIVYTVNNASKKNKTEITGTGFSSVTSTFVANDDFYETPVDWTDVEDITYALVRVIDGVATDIVVFTN